MKITTIVNQSDNQSVLESIQFTSQLFSQSAPAKIVPKIITERTRANSKHERANKSLSVIKKVRDGMIRLLPHQPASTANNVVARATEVPA